MNENPYKSPSTTGRRRPFPFLKTALIAIALIGIAVALVLPALLKPRGTGKPPYPRIIPRSLNDAAEPPEEVAPGP